MIFDIPYGKILANIVEICLNLMHCSEAPLCIKSHYRIPDKVWRGKTLNYLVSNVWRLPMKNLKIKQKFICAFAVVILLFLITGGVAFYALLNSEDGFYSFHDDAFAISSTAHEMRANIENLSKNVCNAIMAPTEDMVIIYIDRATTALSNLTEGVAYLYEHVSTPEVVQKTEELIALLQGSAAVREEVFKLARDIRIQEATDLYFSSYEPILMEAQEIVVSLNDFAEGYANDIYKSSTKSIAWVKLIMILVFVLTVGVVVVILRQLTSAFAGPIMELRSAAQAMAQGNLSGSDALTYHSRDELGELHDDMRFTMNTLDSYVSEISEVLNVMAQGDLTKDGNAITDFRGDFASIKASLLHILKSFNSTLTEIQSASDRVETGASHMAVSSQSLSQGAATQAASTEQLSSSIVTINEQIRTSGEYAIAARDKTAVAGTLTTECNNQMQEMLSAMEDISKSSDEISKIIKAIEDIAFQTNILALNAAVEAARAGAAGKGFAVVADEVRSLAAKSAEASKNTAALIAASMTAVSRGADLAQKTAGNLQGVVDAAGEVNEMVGQIATTAQEQTVAIGQISSGIEQISSVVQSNSASSEETAAASQELSAQAAMLDKLIGRFKLFAK